jgi:subtilase-type serine protease
MKHGSIRRLLLAGSSLAGVGLLGAVPAASQELDYVTLDYGTSGTFFTGIRGDTIVGNDVIPGGTGGLLYRSDTGVWVPFTEATANGSNFPGSYSSSPYGPSFGSMDGILRVVGVYKTGTSPYDIGYLFDAAAAPGSSPLTLVFPDRSPSEPTLFTFPHSQFGNTAVGDYDTQLDTGNAFIYDIPSGTFTTNNVPGEISTTAYGIYGDKIAGGYGAFGPDGEAGFEHGYIYDRPTDTFTTYDHPGSIVSHFEGISGAGRGNEYNLVVDWVGVDGQHAAVLHLAADGTETWIPLEIDGASTVSANSIYGDTVVGVYTDATGVHAYSVKIPGIYNPIRNVAKISDGAADAVIISAGKGDDVVNEGRIRATGPGGIAIRSETYGVVTNYGKVVATGKDGVAVDMNGEFGTLLNGGVIRAAKGADAIRADGDAYGTVVVNGAVIDGRVVIKAGPDARFENDGLFGIGDPGAGVRHKISGLYAQTPEGVLALRVRGARNDRLDIDGVARLDGTVATLFQPGNGLARNYTIVTASDEMTGEFDSLETFGLPSFFKASLDYSDTEVELDLKARLGKVEDLTRNQRVVGRAFDHAFNHGEEIPDDVSAALFALSEDDLPQGLDANSGEIYASQQSVLIEQGLFVREAMLGRLRQPSSAAAGSDLALGYAASAGSSPTAAVFAPDPAFWAQGVGAWGDIDGDGNASDLSTDFGGIVGGLDVPVNDNWTVGVAFGYTQSHTDISDLQSSADVQSGLIGAYAGGSLGAFKLRAGGLYSLNAVDTSRSVSYPGFSEDNKASYDAGLGQLFGEVAYAAEMHGAAIEPFAGLAWVHLQTDDFTEKGGASALSGSSGSSDVGYTTLGIRVAKDFALQNGMVLVPRASLAWQYAFGDLTPEASLAFADASNLNFTVAGAPIAQNAALIDAGFDLRLSARARLGLSYYGQLSADAQQNAVRGNFSWRF